MFNKGGRRTYNKRVAFFLLVVLVLIVSIYIYRLMYNFTIQDDDIFHFNLAKNIIDTGVCKTDYRPLAFENIYSLSYPPLRAYLNAASLKIFGMGYRSIFIPSLFSFLLSCLLFIIIGNSYLRNAGIIFYSCLFFLTDPLFFYYIFSARPETTAVFLYLLIGIFFYSGHLKSKYLYWVLTGIFSGLLFLTTYNGAWVPLVAAVYLLVTKFRRVKEILVYYFFSCIIVLPYILWIFLDEQRRGILWFQVALNSSLDLHWAKRLMNPIADFYLMFFRYHSMYPFLFLISLLILWRYRAKYLPFILLLIVPWIMMTCNMRAEHYLLITMGVCYLSFGLAAQEWLDNKGPAYLIARGKKIFYIMVSAIFLFNMYFNVKYSLRRPDFIPDMDYYRKVLAENTGKDSRIVADAGLFLAADEGRKIFTVVPLIWDRWRLAYKYEDIFKILNPDYIVLTDRIKSWVELKHPQGATFQDLLKSRFYLVKELHDAKHGGLWIYKRAHEE